MKYFILSVWTVMLYVDIGRADEYLASPSPSSWLDTDQSFSLTGSWDRQLVHPFYPSPDDESDLLIADGRNDSLLRLYGVCFATLLELTYKDTSWGGCSVSASKAIKGIAIGQGRSNGITRIYIASDSIYEFSYEDTLWVRRNLGIKDDMQDVDIGVARNDDTARVYAISNRFGPFSILYEFTYSGIEWKANIIDTIENERATRLGVGTGRNDEVARVYVGTSTGFTDDLYEFTYDAGTWNRDTVGNFNGELQEITIGPGRNDGVSRIYIASEGPGVIEFSYNGGNWNKVTVGPEGGKLTLGEGRDDDTVRLYVAEGFEKGNKLLEYSFVDSLWNVQPIGSTLVDSEFMECVAVGSPRNDGKNRVYGGSNVDIFSGLVSYTYEFTYVPTGVEESKELKAESVKLKVYPNPFYQLSVVSYKLPVKSKVSLEVYDVAGRCVKTLIDGEKSIGYYKVKWDGAGLSTGIYFAKFTAGDYKSTKKLILIR